MANRNLSATEYLFNEARHAVHDIRQKLFEEAWFGRVVTAEPVMDVFRTRDADRNASPFEKAWGTATPNPSQSNEREHAAPELDR